MPRYDLWTHGVSAVVEHTDRVESERRTGAGLALVQVPGSDNWVHFAIPTPRAADNYVGVELHHFELTFETHGVRIAQATAHYGGTERILDFAPNNAASVPDDVKQTMHFGTASNAIKSGYRIVPEEGAGVVLCIRPEFTRPRRGNDKPSIRFYGAGARFDA